MNSSDDRDNEGEEEIDYEEEIGKLKQEIESWKAKYKSLEVKKRESDLFLNKVKTEINSLRSVDKMWKECAKNVYFSLRGAKDQFNSQVDQVIDGLTMVSKSSERITNKIPYTTKLKEKIIQMQKRIASHEETIMNLNGRIRQMTAELAEKTQKVEILSQGIDVEVERIVKPIREKLSEQMGMLMKEKAARMQERRELADVWPSDHLLPSLLMKHRALTVDEMQRRKQLSMERNASLALAIEIRANVAESKLWEIKYDDYGRMFYQHSKTGQASWDQPEIMNYKPPEGRDEIGNVMTNEENDWNNWIVMTDNRGRIYYQNKITLETSFHPPSAYKPVPKSKSRKVLVAESAQIVLNHIKDKISSHINSMKQLQEKVEADRGATEMNLNGETDNETDEEEEDNLPELAAYQYDIETVEMLAISLDDATNKSNADKDPSQIRSERRSFLNESNVRKFDIQDQIQGPSILSMNTEAMSIDNLRDVLENLSTIEDKLEGRLAKVRENLKDFSFVLMEKIDSHEKAMADEKKRLKQAEEAEKRLLEKQILLEQKKRKVEWSKLRETPPEGPTMNGDTEDMLSVMSHEASMVTDIPKEAPDPVPNSTADDDLIDQLPKSAEAIIQPIEEGKEEVPTQREVDGIPMPTVSEDEKEKENMQVFEYNESDSPDYGSILFGNITLPESEQGLYSESIVDISADLVNYAVFSGYNNLHIADYPNDATLDYSLALPYGMKPAAAIDQAMQTEGRPSSHNTYYDPLNYTGAVMSEAVDDEWLTNSFFLTSSKENLDKIQESIGERYKSLVGLLPYGSLESKHTVHVEEGGKRESEVHDLYKDLLKPYTNGPSTAHDHVLKRYEVWKQMQLLSDVIRNQLQREAVLQSYQNKLRDFSRQSNQLPSGYQNPGWFYCHIDKIVFTSIEPFKGVTTRSRCIQLNIGAFLSRTEGKSVTPLPLEWKDLRWLAKIPTNTLQLEDLVVEAHDETPSESMRVMLGTARFPMSQSIGNSLGTSVVLEVDLFTQIFPSSSTLVSTDSYKLKAIEKKIGSAAITVLVDTKNHYAMRNELVFEANPYGVDQLEVNYKPSIEQNVPIELAGNHRAGLSVRTEPSSEVQPVNDSTPVIILSNGLADSIHRRQSVDSAKVSQIATIDSYDYDHNTKPNMELSHQLSSFTKLVSDIRGDGAHFMKMLTGQIEFDNIRSIGREFVTDYVKPLPNFGNASTFLKKKAQMHWIEIEKIRSEIDASYQDLENYLNRKLEDGQKAVNDLNARIKKQKEAMVDLEQDVWRIQKSVQSDRQALPLPKEPTFGALPEPQYVPRVPPTGGIDSNGKRKRAMTPSDLKTLIDLIEVAHKLDGALSLPIPENYWPSQAQQLKLNKSIGFRNNVIDAEIDKEQKRREKMMAIYQDEVIKWEVLDEKRRSELKKHLKELRRSNLKYDSGVTKLSRLQKALDMIEWDGECYKNMQRFHEKCKDSFKIFRCKQHLEYQRHQDLMNNTKKRLLKALHARKFALSYPISAQNELEQIDLMKKSEEGLRILKLEIFDCKQLLIMEGVQLREMFHEVSNVYHVELMRVNAMKELGQQRRLSDKILERYKYSILPMYNDLERLKLLEANEDEIGEQYTVDDLGERYTMDKVWNDTEINQLMKSIQTMEMKIDMTEGIGKSINQNQRKLLDVIVSIVGQKILPVRDSWVENSDYERSQQFLSQSLMWLAKEKKSLDETKQQQLKVKEDLSQQLMAVYKQKDENLIRFEQEGKIIGDSTSDVVNVLRVQYNGLRDESSARIMQLEMNIIELSRECQKVREELLNLAMTYDEKVKVLWAFIDTLQTAVQQLSVRMEMILEEREKIVIASKLLADKMRFQLRQERKYSSNLMFVIHAQRGTMQYLMGVIQKQAMLAKQREIEQKEEKSKLQREVWEQLFCFSRLGTDVDALFEFFSARLANLAGARESINHALSRNGAALVLAALCKCPRPLIRKNAARALGGLGWNGFVETRVLLWDCVMYWKIFKSSTIAKEKSEFEDSFQEFTDTGRQDAILNLNSEVEEFLPTGNISLRTLIKQRRQWALRAARRREGPNEFNQRLINVKDGVIPALLAISLEDGIIDWEIARNAALAVSIASCEVENHRDMVQHKGCIQSIIDMCLKTDPEVQTHAAVTIANLSYKDEEAQLIFGQSGAIAVLINLCQSRVVDVLEAASSALSNLTTYCDANCLKILEVNGLEQIVAMMTESYTENLLDFDQRDEVQSNGAEILANVSRYSTDFAVGFFDQTMIDSLTLMCAADNPQLRRHIPLVLGNIAQSEACREVIGLKGGVEALFLVLEDNDTTIQANVLWSLCNLMWHPPNQERAGRFMATIVSYLLSEWEPVRVNASALLANVLFYNNDNRIRFLESEGAMELLMDRITHGSNQSESINPQDDSKTLDAMLSQRECAAVIEGCLRSLLSLSYMDSVALWCGDEAGHIPNILKYLQTPFLSRDCMRFSLDILCNLCLHHDNRRLIVDHGGINLVVQLHMDVDAHVRDTSVKIIHYLEDVTPLEVMARAKGGIGIERMVALATNEDPLVRAVAAESIGEEIWKQPKLQRRVQEIGGMDALLGILNNANEPIESLLPAMWSLRNLLDNNPNGQGQFGYRDGIHVLHRVLVRALTGEFEEHTEKIVEANLACVYNAIIHDERNSRRCLKIAMDPILDLASGQLNLVSSDSGMKMDKLSKVLMESEGVTSFAKSILLLLAPYNYVVCRNCHRKQDLHGTSCYVCGHHLFVEVEGTVEINNQSVNLKELSKKKLLKSIEKEGMMGSRSTAFVKTISQITNQYDLDSKGKRGPSPGAPPMTLMSKTTSFDLTKETADRKNKLDFKASPVNKLGGQYASTK